MARVLPWIVRRPVTCNHEDRRGAPYSRSHRFASEADHKAAGTDDVVDSRARCRNREVAWPRVDVAQLAAESEPAEPANIDAAPHLKCPGVRVPLGRIRAATAFQR